MPQPGTPESLVDRVLGFARDPTLRRKAATFALIGVVNTGVDYGIFAFCYLYVGLHPIAANAVAWIIANTGSYVMNSFITFAAESGRVLRMRDYLGFVGSGLAGFIANTATVVIGSYFVPVLVAKAIAIGVSFVVNFSLSHFVVFPTKRTTKPDGNP
jgi:putative flippase GtrA